jgi:hypothetical protein
MVHFHTDLCINFHNSNRFIDPSVFIRTSDIKSLVIVAGSPRWSSWDGPSCCVPMIRHAVQPRHWRRKLPPHIRPLRVASRWSNESKSEQVHVESYTLPSGVVCFKRVRLYSCRDEWNEAGGHNSIPEHRVSKCIWSLNRPHYLLTYPWLYSPWEPWPLFKFLYLYTFGRTPRRGRSALREAATYTKNNTQTHNKRT